LCFILSSFFLFSFSSFVASKEADIIIYSLVEKKIQDRITTNEIGIRYFTLSPDEKYLATINLKGAVAVYSLSYQKDPTNPTQVTISKDKLETHHVNLVSTKVINEDNVIGLRICWLSETILAIPSNKGSLVLLSKDSDSWKESFLTSDNDLLSHGSNELNLVQKIADHYLLSADLTGKILLWKLNSKNNMELSQPIRDWEASMTLFDFSYETEKNLLFLTSNNNYGMIETVLKESELPTLVKKASPEKAKVVTTTEAPVEVEESITKPTATAVAMEENENDDDADFLAFDLDAFTQNPQEKKTVVQTEATKPMELVEEEVGESFPVENTQMEIITSPVKKLSKLTKAVEEKTVMSTPVETIAKKKNPPLGSLLAAKKDESPAVNKKPAVTKEALRSLFNEEAEEADDFDDEDDDEGEDLTDRKTKKQDDDDLLLDEEDDLDNDFLANDDDAEVKLSGNDSSVLMKEIIKLKKQLKTKSFLMDSVESHPIVHPSSTPADEKSRRYLVWNHLGNISSREEALENRVEIRFTDISYHKNEVIADRTGFTMAALSGDGAAFASDIQDDDSEKSDLKKSKLLMEDIHDENLDMNAKGSVIYYHAFQTQNNKNNSNNNNNPEAMGNQLEGVNQTFRIQLLQKEKVETIALGKGFLAVTTSKNYLRIYNTVGMEMAVVYLKGKIVSLNAYDNVLGVIYHTSNTSVLPISGVFSLSIDVFEINWKNYFKMNSLVTGFPLPFFQPKQKLEWFGFDIDQKIVLIMDNLGNINALMKVMDYQWVPVMHIPSIRKSIDHKYWPITGKNNRLAYILLNGEKKPMVYPQPVTSVKAFKVPLSSMTHLPLSLPQNNKDNNKESGKEKLTNYFYESMKVHHYENLLNEKTHDYLLNYYHIQPMSADGQSNNLEKISVYENHEMSLLSHLTNEMISSYDKMLLTLFQEALVSGQLPFALSLIYQFRSLISFQTAIVISNHFGKRNIAEKVDFILQQKLALMQQGMNNQETVATTEEEENSHVNYDMSADDPIIPHHQPSQLPPKSSSLLSKKAGSTKSFSSAVSNNNNNNNSKMNGKVVTPSSENNNNNKITGNKRPFDEDASYLSHGEDNQPEESQQQPDKKKGVLNPFRIEKTGNTPMKKKSAIEDFSDQMKASPTPKKLNVSIFISFLFSSSYWFFSVSCIVENEHFFSECPQGKDYQQQKLFLENAKGL
jgi:hypothetical protein